MKKFSKGRGHGLDPVTRIRRERKILTIDGEWSRSYQLRMFGTFDGERYRAFHSGSQETIVRELFDYLFTTKNNGAWIFAHWGGTSDVLFFIDTLRRDRRYRVSMKMNGSSANIIKIRRGRLSWNIIDSAWLMRVSLADVAEWVGEKKGGDEGLSWEAEDIRDLIVYNKGDCVILWKAIALFEKKLWEFGGELCMTIASCGMNLFRRRFLKAPILNSHHVNTFAAASYCASRVEVIRPKLQRGYCFDFNSSFPYAMAAVSHPGNPKLPRRTIPDSETEIYIAHVDVSIPSDCYLPPLPVRTQENGRIFFPTGKWTGVYTHTDLRTLLEAGGSILKVHSVYPFEPTDYLRDYALLLWDERKKAIAAGDTFGAIVLKFLLNACYGKFAETEEKEEVAINDAPEQCWKHFGLDEDGETVCRKHGFLECDECWEVCDCQTQLLPGVWKLKTEVDVAHRHVPYATSITSFARAHLWRALQQVKSFVNYCDTDSIFTSIRRWGDSKELGEMKLENEVRNMLFFAPKLYGGEYLEGGPYLKAKGFSLGKKLDYLDRAGRIGPLPPGKKPVKLYSPEAKERFQSLVNGESIEIERMIRMREMIAKAQKDESKGVPQNINTLKRFSLADRPKRCVDLRRNDSRAWEFSELFQPFNKEDWPYSSLTN